MGDRLKEEFTALRPLLTAIAVFLGCLTLGNGFGFLVKRPDGIPALTVMFLFIAAVFALMVRIARPPRPRAENNRPPSERSWVAFIAAAFIASILRMTVANVWHANVWILSATYLLTLVGFNLLLSELAQRSKDRRSPARS